ncbi:efflux RND transporter periplasmic adaptor subunit [Planctobacterium marinum]|uniref:efflux RND transporter periplasmic adaptor subunit n=1 Tax=Planctobacterium marinum TaxID=1631968 RepID=UPI001E58864B|nr:efflux RND transporter periplasmic adaptor subunit [Planctobacterium marinum]MCC2605017.1 efflux RND transporter periplasmic adaptor subunit [Planctobacterium marinum]
MSGPFSSLVANRRPGLVIFLFVIVPVLFLYFLLKAAGAGQVPDAPDRPFAQHVDVIKVARETAYTRMVKVVGRVEASKQAGLGFERGGTLLLTNVDEGDRVVQGQLLAELDTQRLTAQMQEIEAGIARAKADARLAQLSENRIATLVSEKLESSQRLDETREATEAARALVREMEARKDSLLVEFTKSKIYSPFDGTILSRQIDPGSVVGQGMTVFTLQQDNSTEVRMAMSADKVFRLKQGQNYALFKGTQQINARLKSVANARTISTRTVDAIFEITQANTAQPMLLPGDLLTLKLPVETQLAGYWVPKTALTNGIRGMWNLFTVSDVQGEQQLITKAVSIIYADEVNAYVSGALNAQDYVILTGGQKLVPEQQVYAKQVPFPEVAKSLTTVSL